MVARIGLGHHVGGHDTVLGDKVGYSGELAAVPYRVTEEPLYLAVVHRQVTGIDDALEEKVGLLELVVEEDVVLGELEGTEAVFLNHGGPQHVHTGEKPAAAAGLLVGDTLGLHLVGEIKIVSGLNALPYRQFVDVVGRDGVAKSQFLGSSLPALTDLSHHLISDAALSHCGHGHSRSRADSQYLFNHNKIKFNVVLEYSIGPVRILPAGPGYFHGLSAANASSACCMAARAFVSFSLSSAAFRSAS